MGARTIVNIVGLDSLTPEQKQFIRKSGVSHKNPEDAEELAKLFKQEFSGTRLDPQTMRTILRQDQRRHRGTSGANVRSDDLPPVRRDRQFLNNACALAGS